MGVGGEKGQQAGDISWGRRMDVCAGVRLELDFEKFVRGLKEGGEGVGEHEVPVDLLFSSICRLIEDNRSVHSIAQVCLFVCLFVIAGGGVVGQPINL